MNIKLMHRECQLRLFRACNEVLLYLQEKYGSGRPVGDKYILFFYDKKLDVTWREVDLLMGNIVEFEDDQTLAGYIPVTGWCPREGAEITDDMLEQFYRNVEEGNHVRYKSRKNNL